MFHYNKVTPDMILDGEMETFLHALEYFGQLIFSYDDFAPFWFFFLPTGSPARAI